MRDDKLFLLNNLSSVVFTSSETQEDLHFHNHTNLSILKAYSQFL